jgi:hypothetical protein
MLYTFVFIFVLVILGLGCTATETNLNATMLLKNGNRIYRLRNRPLNVSGPSSVNTQIVSIAVLRSKSSPVGSKSLPVGSKSLPVGSKSLPVGSKSSPSIPILSIPYFIKTQTKTWIPTCPSTMPVMCPSPTNSSTKPLQIKKMSEFPLTHRTYLRGGIHYVEKIAKKNLRGSQQL